MSPEAKHRIATVLDSGYIGQGAVVEKFEARLSERTATPVLTTSSGTAALDLALAVLDIGPGDEVISTPMTCTATNHVINNRGAKIVWCDIDPITGLASPESITHLITDKTRAVVVVDWGGECVEFRLALLRRELPIIIDAAHRAPVVDARYQNGSNVFVAYSFQAIKFLTTGDGGALIVPEQYYRSAKLQRWFGLDRESSSDSRCEQTITLKGYKYHMNDIAAAIGLANLEGLDDRITRHRKIIAYYKDVGLNVRSKPDSQSWVAFTHVKQRSDFGDFMEQKGISVSKVHSRNDTQSVFMAAIPSSHDGLEKFDASYIAIPCGWWLTDAEIEHVTSSVIEWEKGHGRPE